MIVNNVKKFSEVLMDSPSHPALVDIRTGEELNYGEMCQYVTGLSLQLKKRQVSAGDNVFILLPNCLEYSLFFLACLNLGAVAVPIDIDLSNEEVESFFDRTQPVLIITTNEAVETFPFLGNKTSYLWSVDLVISKEREGTLLEMLSSSEVSNDQLFADAHDDQLLTLTFTSGTSGQPKGVMHYAGGLLGNAFAFNSHMGIDASTRQMHIMPMSYMAGILNTIFCPLAAGGTIIIAGAFKPAIALRFWSLVRDYNVSEFWASPSMLNWLCKMDRTPPGTKFDQGCLQSIFVGTAPLTVDVRDCFYLKFGIELLPSYGLSELLIVSSTVGSMHTNSLNGVGITLPSVECKQLDSGELVVRTPFAFAGYLNDKTKLPTSPLDVSGWMRTGDLAEYENGVLKITGRSKELIIRGGFNISPAAVEGAMRKCPLVEQVSVFGVPDENLGEEIAAAVTVERSKQKNSDNLESITTWCSENLSNSKCPAYVYIVSEFPLSNTGKVQKHLLIDSLMSAKR